MLVAIKAKQLEPGLNVTLLKYYFPPNAIFFSPGRSESNARRERLSFP